MPRAFIPTNTNIMYGEEIEVISVGGGAVRRRSAVIAPSPPPPMRPSTPARSNSQIKTPAYARASQQEEALEILEAMLSSEQTLPPIDRRARRGIRPTPVSVSGGNCDASAFDEDPVNDHDRAKMCDWYYEMSDFLKIDRATASRSLTVLDRFMAAPVHSMPSARSPSASEAGYTVAGAVVAASRNRDEYQLAALTALFLSIKLYERLNIQPEHVSYLSRGRYGAEEVVRMEVIMLKALEWRVCRPDKVDYVSAFLGAALPPPAAAASSSSCATSTSSLSSTSKFVRKASSRTAACSDIMDDCSDSDGSSSSSGRGSSDQQDDQDKHPLFAGLRDLASLQIQLSDFDSSFSTQRPSLVAFASVINAYEMRKDGMDDSDRSALLSGLRGLMERMYSDDRDELARTADRLRAFVDFSGQSGQGDVIGGGGEEAGVGYLFCGSGDVTPTPSAASTSSLPSVLDSLTPTTYQRHHHHIVCGTDASLSASDDSSAGYVEVSPLDVALESMESFDVSHLLCCGGGGAVHPSFENLPSAMAAAAAPHDDDDVVMSDDEGAESHQHRLLESAVSFGSIDCCSNPSSAVEENEDATDGGERKAEAVASGGGSHSSPTSIATMLFGAAAGVVKK